MSEKIYKYLAVVGDVALVVLLVISLFSFLPKKDQNLGFSEGTHLGLLTVQQLEITGALTAGGNLAVTGNLTVAGTTGLTGATTAGILTTSGALTVNSNATVTGTLAVTGNATLRANAAVGSTTTTYDFMVANGSSTTTVALGDAGSTVATRLCMWNGADYTILSYPSSSTTATLSTSVTCQ